MSPSHKEKADSLQSALAHLGAVDPDLRRVLNMLGAPPPRALAPRFASLLHIMISQQISTDAAAAISRRLMAAAGRLTPQRFLALDDRALAAIGFSRPKMAHARDLARHFLERRLSIVELAGLDDATASARLRGVKGIGHWSAEIFLLFALRRPDILPAADLALLEAARRVKRLERRPSPREFQSLAEIWRPHRSTAARLLWHYYRNALKES